MGITIENITGKPSKSLARKYRVKYRSEIKSNIDKIRILDFLNGDPIWIFTTNYDCCFESFIEKKKIDNYSDGFYNLRGSSIFIRNKIDEKPGIRFLKLHGSIDQYIHKDGTIYKNLPKHVDVETEHMIYPVQAKYIHKEPFFTMFRLFRENLLQEGECIVIGYSFRDDAINNLFIDVITEYDRLISENLKHEKFRIFCISPNARRNYDENKYPKDIKDKMIPIDGDFGDPKTYIYDLVELLEEDRHIK